MLSVPENLPSIEDGEPPHLQPTKGWGWMAWALVGLLVLLALGFVIPWMREVNDRANGMWTESYCRQIIISLKAYASDHGGKYPEGATSNDAFRELFKAGLAEEETVFSAPDSPYVGDNEVGKAPGYTEALKAGENHWAMTKGLRDDEPGNSPLLFENPASASWPPKWDSRLINVAKPGRVWKGNRIVVGRNDGSTNLEHLSSGAALVTVQPNSEGKNLFDLAGPHEVLDVAK